MNQKLISFFSPSAGWAVSSLLLGLLFFATANVQSAGTVSGQHVIKTPILSLLLDDEPIDQTLPVASAGPDSEALTGSLAQLDGSMSTDPSDRPLTYFWSFVSKPETSSATLNSPTSISPDFVLDVPGMYVAQLIVNNSIKDSLPDTVSIRNTNRAPLADAGANTVVSLNQPAQLDGRNSSDIDADPITYLWSIAEKPASSAAELEDTTINTPVFTPDIKGNYIFNLVVNDGLTNSDTDSVEVLAGVSLSIDVADVFFGVGRETTATLRLNLPAPPQGVVITVDVDETKIALAETQITFAEGETEKTFTLTGVEAGITTLSASGINIEEMQVSIEVSGALISIDEIAPLSPSAQRSVAISLSDPAPLGGVTINLESLDTAVATVSPSTLFIVEGQFTPAQNAQITGVDVGETLFRATGIGFAPDEREIKVALTAAFDAARLNVPETLSRNIVLELDAPAPTGGLVFNLAIVGDANFSVQDMVTIEQGQTQSLPISLTGLIEGVSILRATAQGFIDTDATITVIDAPNAFLTRGGSNSPLAEAIVGVGLQDLLRIRLEVAPTSALDIKLTVPENSGVLLSSSATEVGGSTLLIEDLISSSTGFITVQGTELGDDVPLTIEVFKANTNTLAGYEAVPATIDVDPSGVHVDSADFITNTFAINRRVGVETSVLYDQESGGLAGTRRQSQAVRAGTELQVPMQVDDQNLLTLPNGATDILTIAGNISFKSIAITPRANGVATVSITAQPAPNFSLPSDLDDNVEITINAPKAFIRSQSSSSHLLEAIVGVELQRGVRVGFEAAPPSQVDIQVSVPSGSGVGLSTNSLLAGSNQILFTGISSSSSPLLYIQGLAIGDDVPISVNVFNAGTMTPIGYNALTSTVDIDPSGIYVSTSDYNTTTFSNDRTIQVQATLLYDAESPSFEGGRSTSQAVRGGLSLSVPMQVNNVNIASLPGGANDDLTIASGSTAGSILLTPVGAGQATLSIASLPANFAIPTGLNDSVVATITAADAFLRSTNSASHLQQATIGIELQSPQLIGLAATPPAPVDISISVPSSSGVLLSNDSSTVGGTSLFFEDITSNRSPQFYIQGTALGDDVDLTIEVNEANTLNPIGYNVLASTVDVDPSGVYMGTSDYQTNTLAPNRSVSVFSALLYDDEDIFLRAGRTRLNQLVRAGIDLNVGLAVDDDTVVTLPAGASDTLVILAGQSSGKIDVEPRTAGEATVSIIAQPGPDFSLPSNREGEVEVTVTAPNAGFNLSTVFIGDELQTPVRVSLGGIPPNPVDVTIEVIAPSVALVSKDGTTSGSASVTYENVSSISVGTIFVQGLTLGAATEIRVSAAGYNDDTADVEVVPSGFRLSGNFSNLNAGSTRDLTISSARLTAVGSFAGIQEVRGGATFDIVATSSLPGIGTVTSPITFNGGDSSATTTFTAVSAGSTTIEITQPTGFTPPVGATNEDITVN